jgi:SAM-dependent methyltransferase
MPREWDARTYDSLPLPHLGWGLRTLGRLPLRGDERVLDAGCGTGRDTAGLLDRLPDGRVVAVDGSVRMLDQLRSRLAGRLGRVEVVRADLTGPLPFAGEVDAVGRSSTTSGWRSRPPAVDRAPRTGVRPQPGCRAASRCPAGRRDTATPGPGGEPVDHELPVTAPGAPGPGRFGVVRVWPVITAGGAPRGPATSEDTQDV